MSDILRDEPARDEETPQAAAGAAAGGEAVAAELEQLREEAARNLAGWQRAQADYENQKRRSASEVRDRVERSQQEIFVSLVDLADDFQRALEAEASGAGELPEGVRLIEQKLLGLLERNGVRPIAAAGQPFDPNIHEAIGELPGAYNQVVAETRRGWMIGERVLRASQVLVGAGEPDESSEQSSAPTGAEHGASEGAEPCRE